MPSVMQRIGTPNARHNLENEYRKHLDNVDPALSRYNKTIAHRTVDDIYQEHLQPAFDAFNAKQKRKDRRLDIKYNCSTYLEYQRALDRKARSSKNFIDQKGRPPIREIVWQIGNPEQGYGCTEKTPEMREKIMNMLLECQRRAELRYPQLVWGDIVFHADEVSKDADGKEHGSMHLHTSFVPLCFQNKQGPEVQVAFERCLQEMGFESFNDWKHDLDNLMEEVLQENGLERTVMENHEEHQSSHEWHRQQAEIKKTKELEKQRAEKEMEVETLEGKQNAITKQIKDTTTEAIQEVKKQVAKEIVRTPEQYEAALYYIANCDKEERERIINAGQKIIDDTAKNTLSIDELINTSLKTGKGILSKEERSMLWEQYRMRRNEINIWGSATNTSLALAKHNAYNKLSAAKQHLYNADKMLRHSKSLFETLFAFTMIIIETKKVKKLQTELDYVKEQYKDYQQKYNALKQSQSIAAQDLLHCTESAQNALNSMKRFLETSDRMLEPDFRGQHIQLQTAPDNR